MSNGLVTIMRGTVPLALFGPHGYGLVLGTIATPQLILNALASPWRHGVFFDPESFTHQAYARGFGDLLLNCEATVMTWAELLALSSRASGHRSRLYDADANRIVRAVSTYQESRYAGLAREDLLGMASIHETPP